jgi:hypothetical protein
MSLKYPAISFPLPEHQSPPLNPRYESERDTNSENERLFHRVVECWIEKLRRAASKPFVNYERRNNVYVFIRDKKRRRRLFSRANFHRKLKQDLPMKRDTREFDGSSCGITESRGNTEQGRGTIEVPMINDIKLLCPLKVSSVKLELRYQIISYCRLRMEDNYRRTVFVVD